MATSNPRQRLIVCLDGTWNNRDDNTNVLHHANLIPEGLQADGWMQRCYYDTGVGTGPIDRVTGGGFGLGLEDNVREAYNWLVTHFNDSGAGEDYAADEIYIFGFSRGSYTARSLVGFISRCGLLRRGAPMTVRQLWDGYGLLGMQREDRRTFWERWLGDTLPPFRQLSDLMWDSWHNQSANQLKPTAGDPGPVPGQRRACKNETERLLVRWSRRVPITYLGIYDTVGAMGVDALAIPTLRSRLALHHNMRPTTLVQHCRHALAIDEHRSNFSHTPFRAYVSHQAGATPSNYKIESKWFVGAHSNIGGGYGDNRLSQAPFDWIHAGAKANGLVATDPRVAPGLPPKMPEPVDSYRQFARPFWAEIFRAKRNYREIAPTPEVRASARASQAAPGFSLSAVNEDMHESVADYYANATVAVAPNLLGFFKRRPPQKESRFAVLAGREARHDWLGRNWWRYGWLAIWAALAGCGANFVADFFVPGAGELSRAGVVLAAAIAVFVDWAESKLNYWLALGGPRDIWAAAARATLDAIFWTRAFCVLFFALGTFAGLGSYFQIGWSAGSLTALLAKLSAFHAHELLVASLAGGGLGLLASLIFDEDGRRYALERFGSAIVGGLALAVTLAAVAGLGLLAATIAKPLVLTLAPATVATAAVNPEHAAFAGRLLLLVVALAYFLRSLTWCTEPLRSIHLPSIVHMQIRPTARLVANFLESSRRRLLNHNDPRDTDAKHGARVGPAAVAMRGAMREVLWRDNIGFVVVCALFLGYGLRFLELHVAQIPACHLFILEFPVPAWTLAGYSLPGWVWLPLLIALADWLENNLHLWHLHRHEHGQAPHLVAAPVAFAASVVKFTLAIAALVAVLRGAMLACWQLPNFDAGWRGALVLAIVGACLVASAVFLCVIIYSFIARKLRR